MSLTTRTLPPHEWPRLAGTEAETVWPALHADHAEILVVEDGDRIVGTWVLMRMAHVECVWIAPEYRGSLGVVKRLLNGMRELAGSFSPQVRKASISEDLTETAASYPPTS